MILLEINFTNYIPTTLLGLLGLISGYLFFYFKNKNYNKLKEIQSANAKDRIKVIEMSLNDLGVSIDTSILNSTQKFILIKNILRTKTNRYLITSITSIILAGFATFLISNNYRNTSIDKKFDSVGSLIKPENYTLQTQSDISKQDSINNQFLLPGYIQDSLNNIASLEIEDIQDSLDNLATLLTQVDVLKTRDELRDRFDSTSVRNVTKVAITAWVFFQYTDGKTYLHISGYNDLIDNFHYQLEVELVDKNLNIVKLFESAKYEIKGSEKRNKIEFKEILAEIPDKLERLKVKRINAKLTFVD